MPKAELIATFVTRLLNTTMPFSKAITEKNGTKRVKKKD